MKSPNRGAGNRSLLTSGKGDADRTTDNKAFSENFSEIDFGFGNPEGFVFDLTRNKQRKVYGPRAEKGIC